MKKSRILNKYLNQAIASMGHGDFLVISDAGFPNTEEKRIDLAIEKDVPSIIDILDLVMSDFIYERVLVAKEQQDFNPNLYKKVVDLSTRCEVETITHDELITTYSKKAKYIVRTGAFEPWGNVVLCSGVDAPVWFDKPGTRAPDYYEDRVSYKEEEHDK